MKSEVSRTSVCWGRLHVEMKIFARHFGKTVDLTLSNCVAFAKLATLVVPRCVAPRE